CSPSLKSIPNNWPAKPKPSWLRCGKKVLSPQMNNQQTLEKPQGEAFGLTGARWFVALGAARLPDLSRGTRRLVGTHGRTRRLYLGSDDDYALPQCAEQARYSAIFDGALFNRQELQTELGDLLIPVTNDAELVLAGYTRWGQDFLARLRGTFALLLWDSEEDIL